MPRTVDRMRKSEDIGRAALGVFRRLGYHATRMADIAREAGVGKGTLYEYFENKPDILRFAFRGYFDSFRAGADRAMGAADDPAGRLFALIGFALEHASEWEDHCAVYVDYAAAQRPDGGGVPLDDIYGEMRGLLRELIAEGQAAGTIRADLDAGAAAEALLTVYDGVVLHRVLQERPCDMAPVRAAVVVILGAGLRPGRGTPEDA